MPRKTKTVAAPAPIDFTILIKELGLRVVSYLPGAEVMVGDRILALPRDLVGCDGKSLLVHRVADRDYAIDGWCVEHDGMFGGRYPDINNALCWLRTAHDVRAGKRDTF